MNDYMQIPYVRCFAACFATRTIRQKWARANPRCFIGPSIKVERMDPEETTALVYEFATIHDAAEANGRNRNARHMARNARHGNRRKFVIPPVPEGF